MLGPLLGCIADDLTGATDLAALASRAGHSASVLVGIPDPGHDPSDVEVVALKIRTAPVGDAVASAGAAAAWLRDRGARHFYWKYCSTFDSTPQGNIGPVADALAGDLAEAMVVHCPAFPENGRTVYMGNLFVWDQRLDESSMKDHPLTPMRDANLVRLLRPQVRGPVGHISHRDVRGGQGAIGRRIAALAGAGTAHAIADAVSDADLGKLAQACTQRRLLAGGSAFAMHLLRARHGPAQRREAGSGIRPAGGRALVLSGSCSAASLAQVEAFREAVPHLKLDPVTLRGRPGTLRSALDWLAGQTAPAVLVYATADAAAVAQAQAVLGPDAAGAAVEEALAALARRAAQLRFGRIVVAGGETSGAVIHALGIERLEIGPEIVPGVPWTSGATAPGLGGRRLALALKSGNFGGPHFFREALETA